MGKSPLTHQSGLVEQSHSRPMPGAKCFAEDRGTSPGALGERWFLGVRKDAKIGAQGELPKGARGER